MLATWVVTNERALLKFWLICRVQKSQMGFRELLMQ
jgi:hypothetical protein